LEDFGRVTFRPAVNANPEGYGARSPSLAVFLSFLWPGLGQWYQGRSRAALLYALPMVLAVGVIALRLVIGGPESFVADLVTPSLALTAFILLVLLAAWRLVSMADALGIGSRRWRHGPSPAVFGLLTLLVVGVHVWAGSVTWAFYDAGSKIFVGDRGPDASPQGNGATPNPSDPSVDFSAPPFTTPPTATERINVLITGVDSGHDRDHALTDTLMVASIDPSTHTVALLSFPRDISNFHLWDGRTFTGKINSLMTYSRLHPQEFPDGGGLPTLAKEIGYLSGVKIQYFASINLDGFEKMINLVGGVDVVNPRQIDDPMYDWFDGTYGFQMAAGPVHLDGRIGLAYVRSRYGVGDSDFTRAARQQQVLGALRRKLTDPAALVRLPDLLGAAASTIRTNFPASRIDDMISLGKDVDDSKIDKFVLGPPYSVHPPTNTTGGIYTLQLDMTRLAALSVKLFGADSRYSSSVSN
jgi:polyisoprenyl-teichoic acid--peptidoglycan teichoic acid transferase